MTVTVVRVSLVIFTVTVTVTILIVLMTVMTTMSTMTLPTITATVMTPTLRVHLQRHCYIVRYMVDKDRDGPLVSMDLKDFILTVGARSPTPGGGSVAALTATLVSHCLHVSLDKYNNNYHRDVHF